MNFISRFFFAAAITCSVGLVACASGSEEEGEPAAAAASEETGSVQAAMVKTDPEVHVYFTCPDKGNSTTYSSSSACNKACKKTCRVHSYCGTAAHPVECP